MYCVLFSQTATSAVVAESFVLVLRLPAKRDMIQHIDQSVFTYYCYHFYCL